jgi:DNA (cytosine-5)-methyltransferase 1
MPFTFIDLFCGIGGFHTALHSLGGTCVFASDIDEKCRTMYNTNFGLLPHGDITKVDVFDIPDHDVLCAGFPCQPFSNAGHRGSLADTRGTLFREIERIVETKKPRLLLLENVKHIKNIQKGLVFSTILKTFENLGYHMETYELSPHQFGIPQKRERIYFVGTLKKLEVGLPVPIKTVHTILETTSNYSVNSDIADAFNAWNEVLPFLKIHHCKVPVLLDEFKNTDDLTDYSAWKRKYVEENRKLYLQDPTFWDTWMTKHSLALSKRKVFRKLEWQVGSIQDTDSIWNHFIQLRQSGIRVKKATTFPTLVAIVQTPIYGPQHRYLTPRECARLQSFPDSHILHEKDQTAYKHLGNSVNVNVVHHVAHFALSQIGILQTH